MANDRRVYIRISMFLERLQHLTFDVSVNHVYMDLMPLHNQLWPQHLGN